MPGTTPARGAGRSERAGRADAYRITLNERLAGVGSTFPARSMASTRNVCPPNASFPRVSGEVQLLKACPSTEHLKWEWLSDDLNLNVGVRSCVAPDGPEVIVVLGGV